MSNKTQQKPRRKVWGIACLLVAAALVLLAVNVSLWQGKPITEVTLTEVVESLDDAVPPVQQVEVPEEDPVIVYHGDGSCRMTETAAYIVSHRMYRDYVLARVVPMTMTYEDNQFYGPWTAIDDFEATEASNEGLLTQWDEDYYITHDWSEYGQQIRTMVPGDTVEINGRRIVIEGLFDYPKEAYLGEIREFLGWDYLVMQTCEPESDLNRIVYGR